MGRVQRHHEAQGLVHPDAGGQPADEDLLGGHAGGEQDRHHAAGVGEGEAGHCKISIFSPPSQCSALGKLFECVSALCSSAPVCFILVRSQLSIYLVRPVFRW